VSRLHVVDAQFATLRSFLRFLVRPDIRIVTPHQHEIALARLAEPGRMLGAWQKKLGNSAVRTSGSPARGMGQTGQR
jgi:hypothetical protein